MTMFHLSLAFFSDDPPVKAAGRDQLGAKMQTAVQNRNYVIAIIFHVVTGMTKNTSQDDYDTILDQYRLTLLIYW
jgi:hypothetical protein